MPITIHTHAHDPFENEIEKPKTKMDKVDSFI